MLFRETSHRLVEHYVCHPKNTKAKPFAMKKTTIAALLLLLPFGCLFGQPGKVWTLEVLVCDSITQPIKDVAIYDAKNNLQSVTNHEGRASVATRQGEMLYFSHLSFERKSFRVDKRTLTDIGEVKNFTIVTLQPKSVTLPEVSVIENAPHLAYENKDVWVLDYKVGIGGMYLILHKPFEQVLMYVNHNQDTLAQLKTKRKFNELYQDAFGNTHLLSADSAYQMYYNDGKLSLLYGTSKENFTTKLKPIAASTTEVIVKEQRFAYGQQVTYVVVDKTTKDQRVMRQITGKAMEMALNWERDNYRFMLANQKANVLSENPPEELSSENPPEELSKNHLDFVLYENPFDDLSESRFDFMLDVQKRLMLQPVYNPIYVIQNEIIVFDFENGFVCHFDKSGNFVEQFPINFHIQKGSFGIEKKQDGWNKNIIMDEATSKCYAQFTTDGIVTLKEIDLNSGKVKREIRLSDHSFPQNIQIYNDTVYYLYLDKKRVVDQDKRSLYKMKLE